MRSDLELPERLRRSGVILVRGFLHDRPEPRLAGVPSLTQVLEDVRAVVQQAPLFKPHMFNGLPFKYRMTNCGKFGWLASPDRQECKTDVKRGYYYATTNPYTGKPWPPIPRSIHDAAIIAAQLATGGKEFRPETCLVNFYQNPEEVLGLHQDNTERNLEAPVVSISIGDRALFQIGGEAKDVACDNVFLENGDCLVLAGESRMFHHKLARILPGTSNVLTTGGRINLTVRQVN